jgi:acyl dehydratase
MLEALEGTTFENRPYRVCAEKVAEFVDVTGDDPKRWTDVAPPGFAAALLFVVAPELLEDPRVRGGVVHGDQTFAWHSPLRVETQLFVTGTVERVRTRGETAFVVFTLQATDEEGPVVEGRSTFLVGPTGEPMAEVTEPSPEDRAESATVSGELPSPRSASRHDLIRYAAATRDWNPIHWDHASAVAAGLGGVVVHGLLQSAWLTAVAATVGTGDRPLRAARFRYTAPLRPGRAAVVEGEIDGKSADLRLREGDVTTVTGRFEVAT